MQQRSWNRQHSDISTYPRSSVCLLAKNWNAAASVVIAAAAMDIFASAAHAECGGHVCSRPGRCRQLLTAVRPLSRPFTDACGCRPCAQKDRHPHAHTRAAACPTSVPADGLSTAVSRRAALLASLSSVLGATSSVHAPPVSAAGVPPGDGGGGSGVRADAGVSRGGRRRHCTLHRRYGASGGRVA